jgi:hypothetical protein
MITTGSEAADERDGAVFQLRRRVVALGVAVLDLLELERALALERYGVVVATA